MDKDSKRTLNLLAGLCAVLFVTSFVMGVALVSSQHRIHGLERAIEAHTTSLAAMTLDIRSATEQLRIENEEFVCPFEGTSLEGAYVDVSQIWELPSGYEGPVYIHQAALTPTWRMCHYCLQLYDYPWELECEKCEPDLIKARWIQELFEMDGISVEIYLCPDNPGEFRWTNLERMDPITAEEWNKIIEETAERFPSIGGTDDEG